MITFVGAFVVVVVDVVAHSAHGLIELSQVVHSAHGSVELSTVMLWKMDGAWSVITQKG